MTSTSAKLVVSLVFSAIYAAIGLVRHAHFGSNAYDLGIFDQLVWHLGRFERPASTVHGLSNMFGDHFSPIHVLFVPLSWLWSSAGSLIVTQAIAFGASIIPVWIFLERRLASRAAALLALAYALFWGLQRAAQFDVHELAFAPMLIAMMVLSLDRLRAVDPPSSARIGFLVSAALLCLVKEDQIPLVAAACALWALLASSRADRRLAIGLAAAALVIFVLVVRVIIPALNDTGVWAVGSAFGGAASRPASIIERLVWPPLKLQTLSMWLLPFALLPLGSVYGLLLVPLVLERFLSSSVNHWGMSFHYSAPLAPILAMAAGDALARIGSLKPHATKIAAVCVVLSAFLPGRQPAWKVFSPSFYSAPAFADRAHRALAMIPPTASVTAQSPIVPHLSRRQDIYMLRSAGWTTETDYVIASLSEDISPWPMSTPLQLRPLIARYEHLGYVRVFDEQGWIVLARKGAR